jgi:Tripartite tricarboxylate transporter TctB family
MMRQRGDSPDLAFGAFLTALSAGAFYATRTLEMGTAADMGSGFVPRVLAGIILAGGVGYLAKGLLARRQSLPDFAWRPLWAILGSVAVFALCFQHLGLIVAVVAAIGVAGMAVSPVPWLMLLTFGAGIAAFCAVLFVKALGLPLKLWPW